MCCSVNSCNSSCCAESDKCILHCNKDKISVDIDEFFYCFIDYLITAITKLKQGGVDVSAHPDDYSSKLKEYLTGVYKNKSSITLSHEISEYLSDVRLNIYGIDFPDTALGIQLDLQCYLYKNLQLVTYQKCSFRYESVELEYSNIDYVVCYFFQRIILTKKYLSGTSDESFRSSNFTNCTFYNDVCFSERGLEGKTKLHVNHQPFKECNFLFKLNFENYIFSGKFLLNDSSKTNGSENKGRIEEITIKNCIFECACKINDYKIENISFFNTIFNDKFEMKFCNIKNANIDNTNFKKVADFFSSKFECFEITKSIFESFAAFEDTEFGIKNQTKDTPAIFKYITFNEFSNFRQAKFFDGLDIEKANFAQVPNFLNAVVPLQNTPRETFRIIKHSFDGVGNHVDANEYFALEMRRRRRELGIRGLLSSNEGGVLLLNLIFSNFGKWYLLPVMWFIALAFTANITYDAIDWILILYSEGWTTERENFWIECMLAMNNYVADIGTLTPLIREGVESISLFFNVFFAMLTWQIIVAVKRNVRR